MTINGTLYARHALLDPPPTVSSAADVYRVRTPVAPTGLQIYVNISLTVNNVVNPSRRGELNGLAMAVASLSRGLAPFTCSPLFAWSINGRHAFPFNFHFIYILLGLGMLGAGFMGWDVMTTNSQDSDDNDLLHGKGFATLETDLGENIEAPYTPSKEQDTSTAHRKPGKSDEKQGLILAGQHASTYNAT